MHFECAERYSYENKPGRSIRPVVFNEQAKDECTERQDKSKERDQTRIFAPHTEKERINGKFTQIYICVSQLSESNEVGAVQI
jgi:hypothetical protein